MKTELIEEARGMRRKLACEFSYLYQCIMGMGALDIVSNEDEKIYGLKKIMAHYSAEERWM
ncbi:MAG: hypothetical protein SO005_02860, partial [Candidatus Choladocola sp.]|nr:hypothetical protein [Candidatus Choladocola sp.]